MAKKVINGNTNTLAVYSNKTTGVWSLPQ